MKKWLTLMMSLLCIWTLTACGGGEEAGTPPSFEPGILDAMVEKGAFSEELEELDADTAYMLYRLEDYGVAREQLADASVLRSAGATCEEGALLTLTGGDSDLMAKAEQAMKDYVQSQIDTNADYRPAEIPKLEKAVVEVRGDALLVVVAGDYGAVTACLEA